MTTNEDFWLWVEKEMNARDLSFYQLERDAGVGNATVSRPAREWREPTLVVCRAISEGLKVPLESVLRRAGHLPPAPDNGHLDDATQFLMDQLKAMLPFLPREERTRVIETALSYASALAAAQRAMESVNATEGDSASRQPPP